MLQLGEKTTDATKGGSLDTKPVSFDLHGLQHPAGLDLSSKPEVRRPFLTCRPPRKVLHLQSE